MAVTFLQKSHNMGKKYACLLIGCVGWLLASHPLLAQNIALTKAKDMPILIDRIAVVVNNDMITEREVQERLRAVQNKLQEQGMALPPKEVLEKQVIERLIIEKAQLQLAKEAGIKIDDHMLDRTIMEMAEQNKMTLQAFRDQIEKEGMPYATFREMVREDIVLQRLLEREVDSKIELSEAEVDHYLTTQKHDQAKDKEVELAHILIRTPEDASPEALQKLHERALNILKRAQQGDNFGELAAAYSDAQEALQGGMLGWRFENQLPQLFVDAIKKLSPGEVSGLIKSSNGYHILKLVAERQGTASGEGVLQTHVRHILLKVTPETPLLALQKKLFDVKRRIDKGEISFQAGAKEISQDPSAIKGGDLGWLQKGDVPEFDAVLGTLQENQVSDPIVTPYGVHLIEVVARKHDKVSPERERFLARQALHGRKRQEAMDEWLAQLRGQTYVEIKDNK